MRTGAWVRRIAHKDGRITGVEYTDDRGRAFFQPATTVVVATFTLNNVRLLYLSKIGTPYDPATGNGTLGKNLTHQVHGRTPVFFDKPLNLFIGNGALGTRVSDFDGGRVTGRERRRVSARRSWCGLTRRASRGVRLDHSARRRPPPGASSGKPRE